MANHKQRGPDKKPRTRPTFADQGKEAKSFQVAVRLSKSEKARIMIARGELTLSDYIRGFIPETMEE